MSYEDEEEEVNPWEGVFEEIPVTGILGKMMTPAMKAWLNDGNSTSAPPTALTEDEALERTFAALSSGLSWETAHVMATLARGGGGVGMLRALIGIFGYNGWLAILDGMLEATAEVTRQGKIPAGLADVSVMAWTPDGALRWDDPAVDRQFVEAVAVGAMIAERAKDEQGEEAGDAVQERFHATLERAKATCDLLGQRRVRPRGA